MGTRRIISRGLRAGVLGATALAGWFFVIDGIGGTPFATPAFVAGSLFGGAGTVEAIPIALYSVLHYLAFALVGITASTILARVRVSAPLLLGTVVGFLLFDAVFFGSVVVTGVNIVTALGWPTVLVGNVMAGVGLMAELHRGGATAPGPIWLRHMARKPVVREGLLLGVAGAGVVAAWFLVVDLAQGAPLRTPAALGSALFLGTTAPDAIEMSARVILGYTLVHGAVWLAGGLLMAALASAAERTPALILAGGLLFVAFEVFFVALVALTAESFAGSDAWWTIGAGNALAAAAIARLLWKGHPRLVAEIRRGELSSARSS